MSDTNDMKALAQSKYLVRLKMACSIFTHRSRRLTIATKVLTVSLFYYAAADVSGTISQISKSNLSSTSKWNSAISENIIDR